MKDEYRPSFAEVRRRYLLGASPAHTVALSRALQTGDDPLHILSYIGGLGVHAATLQQLHDAINGLEGEEELFAFQCQEGVAVSVASDDEWILFTE
jgi:hypothetical protein